MAAPEGNTYWERREKHGRDRKFTAEEIKDLFIEYFKWCDDNPWIKTDFVRGGESAGMLVNIPTKRPYTLHGFQAHIGVGINYIEQLEKSLKGKDDQESEDLSCILSWARNVCFTNKFEGAAVGAFNATIIARDLGLTDKQDTKFSGDVNHVITGMEVK